MCVSVCACVCVYVCVCVCVMSRSKPCLSVCLSLSLSVSLSLSQCVIHTHLPRAFAYSHIRASKHPHFEFNTPLCSKTHISIPKHMSLCKTPIYTQLFASDECVCEYMHAYVRQGVSMQIATFLCPCTRETSQYKHAHLHTNTRVSIQMHASLYKHTRRLSTNTCISIPR